MSMQWLIRENDSEQTRFLASAANIPFLVASLLIARGIYCPDKARRFLEPNLKEQFRRSIQLPGCNAVAQKLFDAIQENKKIAVYGDYDADGITGCVILVKALRDLGAKEVRYYIPSRLDEGYGMNAESLKKLHADDCSVVVSVDCGINSLDEADVAKQLGIELLITDHHTPTETLPNAVAICHAQLVRYPADGNLVSPRSLTEQELGQAKHYPFPEICGSATALKVAFRLGEIFTLQGLPALNSQRIRELIALAAIGTLADVMPLLDENRALVKAGLDILSEGNVSLGLTELVRIANPKNKKVDEGFVGFQMQPRINAAGRMGEAWKAADLLLSEDAEKCRELADEVDKLNQQRKEVEQKIFREAKEQIDPDNDSALILTGDWHKGVIGIVASRLAEQYQRPAVLISMSKLGKSAGIGVGSGRTIEGFNLYDALKQCEKDYLVRFGGHSGAAGLTIHEKNIAAFRDKFCQIAEDHKTAERRKAKLFLEGVFPFSAFTREAVLQIEQLAPFGLGNNKPAFEADSVRLESPRLMGKENEHFSATFNQGGMLLRGVAWHRAEWLDKINAVNAPIDIAFRVQMSDYSGKAELNILDWRPAE